MNGGAATLAILDVGHGNAGILREDDSVVLFDAARGSHVLEFLEQQSIKKIDLVVLSHSDLDHIGGLVGLLAAGVKIGKVLLNSDSLKESAIWADLIWTLEDARRAGDILFEVGLAVGKKFEMPGMKRTYGEVVSPTPGLAAIGAGGKDRRDRRITSNSISACIRLSFDGRPTVLLTGDMDEVALDQAIEAATPLEAPILVFPHHGGLPGGGDPAVFAHQLLEKVHPDTVLFSFGRSKHENPRPEIVEAIRKRGAHVACTQLSVHCGAANSNADTSHLEDAYSAGAPGGLCCAGTMVIDLEPSSFRFRRQEAHVEFIKSFGKTLCFSE